MNLDLEPEEIEYIYNKLRKMPYDEVAVMVNKMAVKIKGHNDEVEANDAKVNEAEELARQILEDKKKEKAKKGVKK